MIVPLVTLTTITTVGGMITAIWREAVTVGATPFSFCMACGGTISCYIIIFYSPQFDGARVSIQIMLIVRVAVLTTEFFSANVQLMCARIRRTGVTIGTI